MAKMRRSKGVDEVAANYNVWLNGFRNISCKSVGSAHELSCPIPLGSRAWTREGEALKRRRCSMTWAWVESICGSRGAYRSGRMQRFLFVFRPRLNPPLPRYG